MRFQRRFWQKFSDFMPTTHDFDIIHRSLFVMSSASSAYLCGSYFPQSCLKPAYGLLASTGLIGSRRRNLQHCCSTSMPVPAGISLPMMTFSFRPMQRVYLALDGSVGQHACGLLEGSSGKEGLGRQRCLRDTEQHRREGRLAQVRSRRLQFLRRSSRLQEACRSYRRARRTSSVRVARVFNAHLAHHLTNDNLDVLIVDINTLHTVDALHFLNEVILHRLRAADARARRAG